MPHNFDRQRRQFDETARLYIEALQTSGTPGVMLTQITKARAWAATETLRLERDAADFRLRYEQDYLAWHGTLAEADPTPSLPPFTPRHAAVVLLLGATVALGFGLATLYSPWPPLPRLLAASAVMLLFFFCWWVGVHELVPDEFGKPQVRARNLRLLLRNVLITWICALLTYAMRAAASGGAAITDLPATLLLVALLFLTPALAAVLAEQIVGLSWANASARHWAACLHRIAVCEQVRMLAGAAERKVPTTLPPPPAGAPTARSRYRAL